MEWMFLVTACNRARVESRILQVLDHRRLSARMFTSLRSGDEIRIAFTAETDASAAIRTGDLLRKLPDVHNVDAFPARDGLSRTLALFKVLCDQESRLPLLQVISSLGAQVVSLRPKWVAFQIIGTMQDIEYLRESLLPYGLVEAVSVVSAIVRNDLPGSLEEVEISEQPTASERTWTLAVVSDLPRKPRRERATALR